MLAGAPKSPCSDGPVVISFTTIKVGGIRAHPVLLRWVEVFQLHTENLFEIDPNREAHILWLGPPEPVPEQEEHINELKDL